MGLAGICFVGRLVCEGILKVLSKKSLFHFLQSNVQTAGPEAILGEINLAS